MLSAGGNPLAQTVKFALKGLALNMAAELHAHGVAAIAITPGFLRSESMLERLGVTEANWRDHGKKDKNFLESESPLFVGRAVAALAADPNIMERTGQLLSSWELAREYKLPTRTAGGRTGDNSRSISRCCRVDDRDVQNRLPAAARLAHRDCRTDSNVSREDSESVCASPQAIEGSKQAGPTRPCASMKRLLHETRSDHPRPGPGRDDLQRLRWHVGYRARHPVCVVTRLEIGKVKAIVRDLDERAFVVFHPLAGAEGGVMKTRGFH